MITVILSYLSAHGFIYSYNSLNSPLSTESLVDPNLIKVSCINYNFLFIFTIFYIIYMYGIEKLW